MKVIVVFAAFIVLVAAAKPKKPIAEYFADFANEEDIHLITEDDNRPPTNFVGDVMKAKIQRSKTLQGRGKFNFNYETENGISVASIGKLRDDKTFVVSGSYTYTGANGKRYRVRYTADEFGYHPVTELDDQPEVVIKPTTTPAPLPKPTFAPIPKFVNENKFDGYFIDNPHRTGKINIPQTFSNGQSLSNSNPHSHDHTFNNVGQGLNNGQNFNGQVLNSQTEFNGQAGLNGQAGSSGQPGFSGQQGFNEQSQSHIGQTFNTNAQTFSSGNGFNSYNAPDSQANVNGFNGASNGLNNVLNNGNTFNSPNGFNAINGFASFGRTGKSLEQTDLAFNTAVFNKDFVSTSVYEEPNRLYLPANPTYLPPTQAPTYLPPTQSPNYLPPYQQY